MAYLAEFWIILESDLVECAPHGIFVESSETIPEHTKDCNITNTIGLTEFGSVMKKL
jgi:hypothetical protein